MRTPDKSNDFGGKREMSRIETHLCFAIATLVLFALLATLVGMPGGGAESGAGFGGLI